MEKSRFDIISDLFKLSRIISDNLKLLESLPDRTSDNDSGETDFKGICRNVKYGMKTMPLLLDDVREFIAEHEDRELARKFIKLYPDTKRLHDLCSEHADLSREAIHSGVAYLSMEVIRQYFFPDMEAQKAAETAPKPMTRTEAMDCIDAICLAIRKCAEASDKNRGKETYAMLDKVGNAEIQSVKEYIVNANDKDLARLFTQYFADAVRLSAPRQNSDTKAQSAGVKMAYIAMTMGYIKRNVLRETSFKAAPFCMEETSPDFIAADTANGKPFDTTVQVPVLRLYRFLTTYTVQSGADKGKPLLNGNAVSDKDFLRAVMRADYSKIYGNCVKGKMRCIVILFSKAYFKEWKEYRSAAACSMGLTPESLAKYNVERPFIEKLKELFPMIK